MIVVKPTGITDSNLLSSTIPEPDLSRNEALWEPSSDNLDPSYQFTQVCRDATHYYAIARDKARVFKFDLDFNYVSEFSVAKVGFYARDIACEGGFLYVLFYDTVNFGGSASTVNKLSLAGVDQGGEIVVGGNLIPRMIDFDGGNLFVTVGYGGISLENWTFATGTLNSSITIKPNLTGGNFTIGRVDNGTVYYINDNFVRRYSASIAETLQGGFQIEPVTITGFTFYDQQLNLTSYTENIVYFYTPFGEVPRIYTVGEQAIRDHVIYQATTTTSEDPILGVNNTPPTWVKVAPSNKFAMYDTSISTKSLSGSPLVQVVTSAVPLTAVAGFGIDGATGINVTVDAVGFGEVYNNDIPMNDESQVTDAWTYFFSPIEKRDRFVLLDIPPFNNITITVTITGGATIEVGALVFGPQISIGVANHSTAVELLDFSRSERNTFGEFETVNGATADLIDFDVTIQRANVSYVRNQMRDLSQVDAVWVGEEEAESGATLIFGRYEKFRNILTSKTITKSTIKVKGIT